jgi:hypothetical protein
MNIPPASSTIDAWIVKTLLIVQMQILARNNALKGIFAQAPPGDKQAAYNESAAEKGPQDAPYLHRYERKSVCIHQAHEHAAQEIIEGGEEDQSEQTGDSLRRSPACRGYPAWIFAGCFTVGNFSLRDRYGEKVQDRGKHHHDPEDEHQVHTCQSHEKAADGRCDQKGDPGCRPGQAVGPVATVLREEHGDDGRERNGTDIPGDHAGEQQRYENPECEAGWILECSGPAVR